MPRVTKAQQAIADANSQKLREQMEIAKQNREISKKVVTIQMLRDLILNGKSTDNPIYDEFLRDFYRDSFNGELEMVLRNIEAEKASMLKKFAATTFKPDAYADEHAVMHAFEELAYLHPKSDFLARKKNYFMEVDTIDTSILVIEAEKDWKAYVNARIIDSVVSGRSTCPLTNYSNDRKLVALRDIYKGW